MKKIALGLFIWFLAAPAWSLDASGFRNERPVLVGAAGEHRLPVDAALIEGSEPGGGLGNLRFFDSAGKEVPYLLVHPSVREPSWQEGTLVPVHPTKDASGFELDLGGPSQSTRFDCRDFRRLFSSGCASRPRPTADTGWHRWRRGRSSTFPPKGSPI